MAWCYTRLPSGCYLPTLGSFGPTKSTVPSSLWSTVADYNGNVDVNLAVSFLWIQYLLSMLTLTNIVQYWTTGKGHGNDPLAGRAGSFLNPSRSL
jgi:hypothetical protein